MSIGVYGIFDKETDECLYVGMSKNLERRWKDHLKLLKSKKHKRKDFVEWYHDNGANPEILDFRILEECDNDNDILNTLEIKWFNRLKPKYFGKRPSVNEKWEHSEETKKKIIETFAKKKPPILIKKCKYFGCEKTFETEIKKIVYCSRSCSAKDRMKINNLISYDDLYDLYWNQKKSRREIGDIIGVKRSSVGNLMKNMGIPTRYKGGTKK